MRSHSHCKMIWNKFEMQMNCSFFGIVVIGSDASNV
jgi:hypothetical protein